MCGGLCSCPQLDFCFGNLMYIFEKLAICCAMSAVITCIIITVLVSLGLGIGVGYNYSIIDLKSVELEHRIQDTKTKDVSDTTPVKNFRKSGSGLSSPDSALQWGPGVQIEEYGSKRTTERSNGQDIPAMLEAREGQDIAERKSRPEITGKPEMLDGPGIQDVLGIPRAPESSGRTEMPRGPKTPSRSRSRSRLGLKVESKLLGESKSLSGFKSLSVPKVPGKQRKPKNKNSGSRVVPKRGHAIFNEHSATSIDATVAPSRTVLDISDVSNNIDEPETETSPTRSPTQKHYWRHPLWQTSFRGKEIVLSDFQFPQKTNANSYDKDTGIRYIDDTERKKAYYKTLKFSAVDKNNKGPQLPSLTVPLNDTNVMALISEILRQKQNVTLQFLNT